MAFSLRALKVNVKRHDIQIDNKEDRQNLTVMTKYQSNLFGEEYEKLLNCDYFIPR